MKDAKSVIKKLLIAILGPEQAYKFAGNYSDFKTLMTYGGFLWLSGAHEATSNL